MSLESWPPLTPKYYIVRDSSLWLSFCPLQLWKQNDAIWLKYRFAQVFELLAFDYFLLLLDERMVGFCEWSAFSTTTKTVLH